MSPPDNVGAPPHLSVLNLDHICKVPFSRKIGIFLGSGIVQSLNFVQIFVIARIAACQASLSFTIFQSLLRLMSMESVMPSNHLTLCHPLLQPSIFPSIRVFSSESALHIRWPLSHPYIATGQTIALTRQTFVDKVISLLFNMLSRLVITFLPRS